MKKQILSFLTLGIFLLLAAGSAVNKMSNFSFGPTPREEDVSQFYVELMDGTKIEADEMKINSGLFSKKEFKVDGETFPIKQVRGYMSKGIYYGRTGNMFVKRIVHGKINVYEHIYTSTSYNNQTGMGSSRQATRYYYQKGNTGELISMGGQKDIVRAVADCPLAVEMADLKSSKIRKAIRKNPLYLNSIFETYNNDCKPLPQ